MKPDFDRAAIAASETLIHYNVTAAPIDPLPILKSLPDVLVITFEDISKDTAVDGDCIMSALGVQNKDAFTCVDVQSGRPRYVVAYNQRLSMFFIQHALARELGHIVLRHDGSLPEDVRNAESKVFAQHFLYPRPLIHAVIATGLRFTTDVLGNLTGCFEYCLSCLQKSPLVTVPADLNRSVRNQFMPYIVSFFDYMQHATHRDGSALANLGSYMDGYEE